MLTQPDQGIVMPKQEARLRMSDVLNVKSIGQTLFRNMKETTQQLKCDL